MKINHRERLKSITAEEINEVFNKEKTLLGLAKRFNCGHGYSSILAKRAGIVIKRNSGRKDWKLLPVTEAIINDYKLGMNRSDIAKKFSCEPSAVKKLLIRNNIPLIKRSNSEIHRKYEINENFFATIDTPDKAWLLGFLYADGYNQETCNSIGIKLSAKDLEILEVIRKLLNSNAPIKLYSERTKIGNLHQYCKLYVKNKKLSEDLAKHGCMQRKTFKLIYPNIPEELDNHFIRGYFDGDGSIWKNKEGTYHFNIVGTFELVSVIKEKVEKACTLNNVKIQYRRSVWRTTHCGNVQMTRIYEYLYKGATTALSRKRKKFEAMKVLADSRQAVRDEKLKFDCSSLCLTLPHTNNNEEIK